MANANTDGSFDAFVAKLTDAGASSSFAWVQRAGGLGSEGINALAVSGTSVYATGTFSSATATFGPTTLTNAHPFSQEVFVAKLIDAGSSGSFSWAQRAGADFVSSVAVAGRNVYIAGSFSSFSVDFGGTTFSGSGGDAYVAKITDSGNFGSFTWAQPMGGADAEQARAVAVSGTSVYVGGYFNSSTASFGPLITLANASGSSRVLMDAFVAKLTDAGNTATFAWAQRAGGTNNDLVGQLVATGTSIYAVGNFSSATASFGSTTLARVSVSDADVFVAKLTDAGSTAAFNWVQQAGGNSFTEPYAAALSARFLYVAGSFARTAQFGSYSITSPLGSNGFLASLTDPTLTATTSPDLSGAAFTLAPNPAHATTTVQLPALSGTATATLTLRDALGRAIRTATVALPAAGLRHEFDLTSLPAGIYALQVQAGAATATRRLVVE